MEWFLNFKEHVTIALADKEVKEEVIRIRRDFFPILNLNTMYLVSNISNFYAQLLQELSNRVAGYHTPFYSHRKNSQ